MRLDITMTYPHIPVLLNECLRSFEGRSLRVFIDATLGAGGHAEAILIAHPEIHLFIGIDQDPEALEIARKRLGPWENKLRLFHGNFSRLGSYIRESGVSLADGILLDLGVSSMQLDKGERGFSLMRQGPLDMRMDPTADLTAFEIINEWSEEEIGRIFRVYGEEKKWRAAARAIIYARKENPIRTTQELVAVLQRVLYKQKGIHPATLIFQGLRICVNRELEVLEKVLPEAIEWLAPEGRMGVITFHSLEDRIVKQIFRFSASDKENTVGFAGVFLDKEPIVSSVTRKPLVAGLEEIRMNPRSRSAKLRVIEKLPVKN